jgi:hypothetical protein
MNILTILFVVLFNFVNLPREHDNKAIALRDTDFVYVNHIYKFSLIIPKSFEYSENFPNSLLTILRKQGEKPDPTNLTLRINWAPGVLENYHNSNIFQLKKEMPNAKIIFDKKIEISKYYCYVTDIELLNNNVLLHSRLFTFLESGRAFHFSLVSRAKDFDKAIIDFTNILQTLKIE